MTEIGTISRRNKEGLRGGGKIIWMCCPGCNTERWVPFSKPDQICRKCSGTKANQKVTEWRKTHEHRPDCKCSTCYKIDQQGANNPSWNGGKTTMGEYVGILLLPDDPLYEMGDKRNHYALEHRLVMARKLGRPLRKDETVHHKNGIKTDNRIENLELWIGNHGKGSRVEDILNEYAEFFGYFKR